MKIKAIASWFGSKRTLAPTIVQQLGPHRMYFELCCGSMAVLFAKEPCEHEMVCDLHGALVNLALTIQDQTSAVRLFNRLQRTLYDEEIFSSSRAWLEDNELTKSTEFTYSVEWAYHYFLASWMGRNGVSGTARHNYQMATRWTAGGGSGPLRFRNAVDSIPAWCERLRNVHIMQRNVFDVLPKIEDAEITAIYVDPPYLWDTRSGSSRYLHDFSPQQHRALADMLREFKKARIVVSYYDHECLDLLYEGWSKIDCSRQKLLHVQNKRGMGRNEAPEVLMVNGAVFESAKEPSLF